MMNDPVNRFNPNLIVSTFRSFGKKPFPLDSTGEYSPVVLLLG